MYDIQKAQQLQKQSHVRGALSKQFYSNQQSQLQKKRRQMKRILDQQVQEKKRVKQKQKQQQEMRQHKQEQQIKRYYQNVDQRQRRISQHSSLKTNQNTNRQNQSSTFNVQNQSLIKKHIQQQQNLRQRVNSKTQIHQQDDGNYPLIPLMSISQGNFNASRATNAHHDYVANSDRINAQNYYTFQQNAGNIPLLDLSDQNQNHFMKNKKKSKTVSKRQPTERENNHLNNNQTNRNSINKLQQSKYNNSSNNNNYHQSPQNTNTNILVMQNNQSSESFKKKERRRTLSNDQNNFSIVQQHHQNNMLNSRLSKGSKVNENIYMNKSPGQTKRNTQMDIPEQIQQMETQNRQLKSQLKKSQQAISLLIGAVRSNPKLDRFRVQAEKILHNNASNQPNTSYHPQTKFINKKQQSPVMLPKIKVKHQSIMHDYLFQAAKRARVKHIKSQASKY